AAWLVGRFAQGCDAFDRAHDVFRFALLAGALSTLASATIGAASLLLGGLAHGGRLGPIWLTWWLGDLGGALVVAPPLLLWFGRSGERWTRRRAYEAAALLLITLLVGLAVFGG